MPDIDPAQKPTEQTPGATPPAPPPRVSDGDESLRAALREAERRAAAADAARQAAEAEAAKQKAEAARIAAERRTEQRVRVVAAALGVDERFAGRLVLPDLGDVDGDVLVAAAKAWAEKAENKSLLPPAGGPQGGSALPPARAGDSTGGGQAEARISQWLKAADKLAGDNPRARNTLGAWAKYLHNVEVKQ